jgi:hypothetical protein
VLSPLEGDTVPGPLLTVQVTLWVAEQFEVPPVTGMAVQDALNGEDGGATRTIEITPESAAERPALKVMGVTVSVVGAV